MRSEPKSSDASKFAPAASGATIVLRVEDNGQGIPAYVLLDIFDAFATTRLDAQHRTWTYSAEGIITQHSNTIASSNRPQGSACLESVYPPRKPTHRSIYFFNPAHQFSTTVMGAFPVLLSGEYIKKRCPSALTS